MASDRDYVLGTHDDEIERLGLQHQVWRPVVLDCWRRAGIGPGMRVLDVGAGPGFAALDLADIVGPRGAVVAVERSGRFLEAARRACARRKLSQVQFHELDLMTDPLPPGAFDASWCRWVASFVTSPHTLVQKLAGAVREGGVAVFHEYVDYSTWRCLPRSQYLEELVREVMASWRASQGEPDIAPVLVPLLNGYGFRVRETVPRVFCVGPADDVWRWPAAFMNVGLDRLLELGRVTSAWVESARQEFAEITADPRSRMITPMVLEIIAERRGSEDSR